ncbi:glycosyltransferase family 4 protein [bacterium]|nr:glycosyltransferase family 4 protein [bacterium]
MKKILIVTEYFYPNDNSTSYYITNIAKKLAKKNHVKVICNTELFNNEELKINNLEIQRLRENKLSKNNIITRILKFVISSLKLSFLTYKNLKINNDIFAVTNPAFIIILLALLKKIRNFNYSLLIYDVFPENLIATKIIKNNKSILYKIFKTIFDWSYLQADKLIVIGRDMEEIIREKTNYKIPTVLIENWCNYNEITPYLKKSNLILKKLNIVEKKVFLFAGNFGRVQGINNLLESIDFVKNDNFILLFIGDGAMKGLIEKKVLNTKKNNIIYAGFFPQEEQNIFLNACDIAVVSLGSSMYGLGVPSKSYFNMAAAKPILYIGDKNSEIARTVIENDIGWVVENEKPLLLAELFDKICDENSNLEEFGKRARELVKSKYSEEVILKKYANLYMDY